MATPLLIAVVVLTAFGLMAPVPSGSLPAQDEDGVVEDELFVPRPVDALVALPGTCPTGAPVRPGIGIDCFFEVLPDVDPAELRFAEVNVDGVFTACRVEQDTADVGPTLRCPELGVDRFEEGSVDVDLWIEGEFAPAAASLSTSWEVSADVSLFRSGDERVVFEGRPLVYESFVYEAVDGLFVTVRERGDEAIVDTIEIEVFEPFTPNEIIIEPDLPIGRYRTWPCVGATAATCEEQSGGQPFQVINGEPLELIAGHNRPSADRINILFVSSGLQALFGDDRSRQLPQLARTLLTMDGPAGTDYAGNILADDEPAPGLLWGPMAIEPMASHADRFNFWYLADEVGEEKGILFGGWDEEGDAGFGLPNLQITALYNDGSETQSDARGTSFESVEPGEVPLRGRIRFGDARVWISEFDPPSGAVTLAHEWGHGLFGLRDEYYGFDDRPIAVGFPNCAPDIDTAEQWWGDLIGAVDPFVERVVEIQTERLEEPEFLNLDLVERTTIEITAGGCYSDVESTEVYRPSVDSLMNRELPVFGVVNRQRVQEVLDRFSGRGPMTSLDDLTIACEAETGFINCRGELETYLDRPLSIVAINSNPCEFGNGRPLPGGQVGPVPVTCTTIAPPNEPVQLTFKGQSRPLDVIDVNPPPPPVPIESRLIPEADTTDDADDASGGGSGRTVAIGALLCAAAIALGFVERRRRSAAEGQ